MSYQLSQFASIAPIKSGTPAAAAEILDQTKKSMFKMSLIMGGLVAAYYAYRHFS